MKKIFSSLCLMALSLSAFAATFNIYINNQTGWTGFFVYAWGSSEAFGAWPGSDQLSLDFQAADGEVTLHLIFHNNVGEGVEGDQRLTFDITEARDYTLVVTAEGVTEGGLSAVENIPAEGKTVKRLVNGQLVIIRDGKTFNALGAEVK